MNTAYKPRPTSTSLKASTIRELYLKHLGRLPESEDIIDYHTRTYADKQAFEDALITSPEIARKAALDSAKRELLSLGWSRRARVDVDISPSTLHSMFARTQRQWELLGKTEPYWSVVTAPEFKAAEFVKHRASFFDTGKTAAQCIDAFCERNKIITNPGTVIELGCGVGRVTVHLAKRFSQVIAVDISSGNLDRCRLHVDEAGLKNVTPFLLEHPSQLETLPLCDFFYSVITLQHNPPPVAAYFLAKLLGRVKDKGAALFQVPTHMPGYSFDAASYLASPSPLNGMELHCVPMPTVYDILTQNDFVPLETLADPWTGLLGSHTFFAVRK